jgi:hypothetical protein
MARPTETVRILAAGDEPALEAFLRSRRDTTMFLRGNLGQAGLVDRGERHQGTYAGVFGEGALVGVVAQFWNGMLMAEAARGLGPAADAVLAATGRAVSGFAGVPGQIGALRAHLGLAEDPTRLDSEEVLFGLDLDALRVPAALASGTVRCRRARRDDRAQLEAWSRAYHVETHVGEAGPELDARVASGIASGLALRTIWILEERERPVAMTRFNAATPDCVQVGGVYTPPRLRARGHGRCVVAGSLRDARAQGAERSILFTGPDNHAARAAYRALGYGTLGRYAIVLLREPRVVR